MKKILLLAGLFSLSAQALELKVVDMSASTFWGGDTVNTSFAINEDLGRAWMNTVSTPIDSDLAAKYYRTKVQGLSFDVKTQELVLEVQDKRFVCANLEIRGRGIFKHKVLIATDSCQLKTKYVKVQTDNGYEVETDTRYQVFLIAE